MFCAVGTLLTDLKHLYARTFVSDTDALDLRRVSQVYREMRDEAITTLRSENVAPDAIELIFTADIRYVGQFDEIEVPLEFDGDLTPAALKQLLADFEDKHESLNGYSMPGESTELINVRLTALGRTTKPSLAEDPSAGQDPSAALKAPATRSSRAHGSRWTSTTVFSCTGTTASPGPPSSSSRRPPSSSSRATG